MILQHIIHGNPSRTLLAVVSLLVPFANPAIEAGVLSWEGDATVYLARWFNGSSYETHEFQYYLDWQGYLNTHAGAESGAYSYWGVSGNWDAGTVPTLNDDVISSAGSTIRVASYNSLYYGMISGSAAASSLNLNGDLELFGTLSVGASSGYISGLSFGASGKLVHSGTVSVAQLKSGGTFEGVGGTTNIQSFGAGLMPIEVNGGHNLNLGGTFQGSGFGLTLSPQAGVVNEGTLELNIATIGLQGSASQATLPRLTNANSGRISVVGGGHHHERAARQSWTDRSRCGAELCGGRVGVSPRQLCRSGEFLDGLPILWRRPHLRVRQFGVVGGRGQVSRWPARLRSGEQL